MQSLKLNKVFKPFKFKVKNYVSLSKNELINQYVLLIYFLNSLYSEKWTQRWLPNVNASEEDTNETTIKSRELGSINQCKAEKTQSKERPHQLDTDHEREKQ